MAQIMFLTLLETIGHWVLRLLGYRSRWVQSSVGMVHIAEYTSDAPGPAVLLLHGIGANYVHFFKVLVQLRGRVGRVIAADLPGHGWSERAHNVAPDTLIGSFNEVMADVLDQPVVAVGNSLGGVVAIRVAQALPDRVRGLVLISPGAADQPEPELQQFLDNFRVTTWAQAAAFTGRMTLRPPWHRWLVAGGVLATFQSSTMRSFVAKICRQDLLKPEDLAGLNMPIWLYWGTADHLMPDAHRRWYLTHMPAHTVLFEPLWPHCPQLDCPGEVVEAIVRATHQGRRVQPALG
jgi:pimeloyl-ACP methyl ester carboxylesterase